MSLSAHTKRSQASSLIVACVQAPGHTYDDAGWYGMTDEGQGGYPSPVGQVERFLSDQGAVVQSEGATVNVDMVDSERLVLSKEDDTPSWNTVDVRIAAPEQQEYQLVGDGWERLGGVELEVGEGQDLRVTLARMGTLRIKGTNRLDSQVRLRGLNTWSLVCERVEIHTVDAPVVRNHAAFDDCDLVPEKGQFVCDSLVLLGLSFGLVMGTIDTEWATISTDCILSLNGTTLRCENLQVFSETGRQGRLNIKSGVFSLENADDLDVSLFDSARLELLADVNRVTVDGVGSVKVAGRITEATFSQIELTVTGTVTECRGRVAKLIVERRAVISGGRDSPVDRLPLAVDRVEKAAQADISGVDIFACGLTDLTELRKAGRFQVWMPDSSGKALERANAMEHLNVSQRAAFWMMLSSITHSNHAPGALQSTIRSVTAEMRRLAASGRERRLLGIFRWIGYGERIALPLFWFLGLVLVSSLVLGPFTAPGRGVAWSTWWPTLWRLAIAPLRFFRLGDDATAISGDAAWRAAWVLGVQAVGIVLFLFSLLAIRRVTRAE